MALRVFGLTGGIGSGKSAVAARLRARGLTVVDADVLARQAVAPGSAGLAQVVAHFGTRVLRLDGELDRPALGQIVFSDAEQRRVLDGIVHPAVRALAASRFQEVASAGATLACYEVPLLYEVGLERAYQPVVVVDAPLGVRRARIAARDGLDETQVMARISAQIPLEDKVRRADYVIDNAGSLAELSLATDGVLDQLCRDLGLPLFS